MQTLATRVVEAYGGEALWRTSKAVRIELSAWGWAGRLKWRPPLLHVRQELTIGAPLVRLEPINGAGDVACLDGHRVRIERPDGTVVSERANAREGFPYGLRRLRGVELLHAAGAPAA